MTSISVSEVQELVSQLPEEKLPHAYQLLRDLAEPRGKNSDQEDFMRLPIGERRRLLGQQAAEMTEYYEQMTGERQEWQSGDFRDEN